MYFYSISDKNILSFFIASREYNLSIFPLVNDWLNYLNWETGLSCTNGQNRIQLFQGLIFYLSLLISSLKCRSAAAQKKTVESYSGEI